MRNYVAKRHPYIKARAMYLGDQITALEAIALVASDREFIAECELSGLDTKEEARAVVLESWRCTLVSNIQRAKRLNAPVADVAQFALLDR